MFCMLINCPILFAGPLKQNTLATRDKRKGEVAKSGGSLGNPVSMGRKTQQTETVFLLFGKLYCVL